MVSAYQQALAREAFETFKALVMSFPMELAAGFGAAAELVLAFPSCQVDFSTATSAQLKQLASTNSELASELQEAAAALEGLEAAVKNAADAIARYFARKDADTLAELKRTAELHRDAAAIAATSMGLWGAPAAEMLLLLAVPAAGKAGNAAAEILLARAAGSVEGLEAIQASLSSEPVGESAYRVPVYATRRALQAAGLVAAASRDRVAIEAYHAFVGRICGMVLDNGPIVAAYMVGKPQPNLAQSEWLAAEPSEHVLDEIAVVFGRLGADRYQKLANGFWLKALPSA